MKKYIRYTHPAAREFDPNLAYEYNVISKIMTLDEVKVFFEPIDFKWEDVEVKKVEPIIKK